ncbi:hypothetical protein EUX98_g1176 [Antrodiella citrinella]|uniref:Arrestin-like N-terminal domain-containing protein n=1 Tax=Antrodiella citrinella TaxID=2447956 RepID=A0A4S4N3P7_9APHY|nr:hypothetical protein EUX98_g1176 [Antrodiella citrinella]
MKDCSSILEVTTTGIVKITMSERTMVAGVAKKTYMSEKATLFKSESATSLQAGTTYPFLLTFPEHVIGSDTPLPPSSSLFQPHASAEISYTLQVDIVRGAFRRHEIPRFPPLTDMPLMLPGLVLPEGMRRVDVSAVWPASGPTQRTDKDLAVVQLYVPEPSVFASGETIHLALSISCPHSPAIPKLLSDSIGIFLVKRRKVWINEGRQISVREVVVEKVTELHVNSMLEGTMYLTAELTGGQHGTECSWGILGYAAIEYIIRVIVRPPTYANHLPTFKHDEVVQMCTDSYGTHERELLIMDGTPMPALGLTNVVAPPRSPHHISDIPSSH